ncbi:HigA family addiction module antitoxin [Luteibacter aegosomaticola]|uniref:HigA family addiction module antitoxin n=1 Tax=Luteibacter aegosomaticola TaxID=2911538 RepID=UPI001FF94ECC|nr:HigA family addiction module antitoxin [Luteibacter aegosomaticola]UPG88565.1 HigA family addiction module antitoxin [Luteibacter aegosomaticola]
MGHPLPPVHPGEVLREDFMKPFGLSSNALALAIGVTAARVNELVSGKRGMTADTALRLARYFGTDPHSWMNLQLHYELEQAERRLGDALARIQPRAA